MDKIVEFFDNFREDLVVWIYCLVKPSKTYTDIITKSTSGEGILNENKLINRATRIWFSLFIISLGLQLPFYQLVGLGIDEFAFHLPNFLLSFIVFAFQGVCIHFGLSLFQIQSSFSKTYLMLTVIIGRLGPIYTLLSYSSLNTVLALIKSSKEAGESFFQILQGLFSPDLHYDNIVGILVQPLFVLVSLISLVIFANFVSNIYNSEKYITYSALSFSLVVFLLIPTQIIGFMSIFIIYTII